MTAKPNTQDIELISAYLDDVRSPELCERMQFWLSEHPENVAMFVDQMLIDNDVSRLVLAEDLTRYVGESRIAEEESAIPPATHVRSQDSATSPKSALPKSARWPSVLAGMALAASVLLLVAFANRHVGSDQEVAKRAVDLPNSTDFSASPTDTSEGKIPSEKSAQKPIGFVATVSDADNCRWESDTLALYHGQHLLPGTELSLTAGLAQLTFESGAVVILEGPCRLRVAHNAVDLVLGRVSATIPESAVGFSVETPNSQVVDLGTEFGINVDLQGDTEIHVFKGEVVSRRKDDTGQPAGEFFRLTADHAIAFRRGSKQAEAFESNEAAFTRRLRKLVQHDRLTAPVDGDLLLWLAADHGVLQDETGGVIAWLDTLTASTNQVADNALQPVENCRPRLIDNAIGSLPAVRFDGHNDCLTTTPMSNRESQTIAFVAAFDPNSNLKGNLISYNGPPQVAGAGDLSLAIQNKLSILQIRACRLSNAAFPAIDPYVYAGHWKGSELFVGRMEHQSRARSSEYMRPDFGEPFVAVYVYDKAHNRAELFINGKSYGHSTAPVSAAITSRKVIARHGHWPDYFHGDVAELLIYDEGLDKQRTNRLTQQLASKYSIAID